MHAYKLVVFTAVLVTYLKCVSFLNFPSGGLRHRSFGILQLSEYVLEFYSRKQTKTRGNFWGVEFGRFLFFLFILPIAPAV